MDLDDLLEEFEDEKKQPPQKQKVVQSDFDWNDTPSSKNNDDWGIPDKKVSQPKPYKVQLP